MYIQPNDDYSWAGGSMQKVPKILQLFGFSLWDMSTLLMKGRKQAYRHQV